MSTYTKLIEELRLLAKYDRDLAGEAVADPEFAPAIEKAADAIETLLKGNEAYAKANAELTAWKTNAQEWMQKVAEEKVKPVQECIKPTAPEIVYICDRRACACCNSDCHYTADIRHAENFAVTAYGGIMEKEDRA